MRAATGFRTARCPTSRFDAFVDDLETVVDAAGIDRFALLGMSQGCAVSVAYAVRHPERVSRLILFGGYPWVGKSAPEPQAEKDAGDAMLTLMRLGWGQENPAFRQLFTSQFIPGGTKEQADWFNELQRISASPDDAVRNLAANGETDVTRCCRRSTCRRWSCTLGMMPGCPLSRDGGWPPASRAPASFHWRAGII